MTWPLALRLGNNLLQIPSPGRYVLEPPVADSEVDDLLAGARAELGNAGVGWLAADGGLLGNLPTWENILLSTQWHAPAALPALETRLRAWMVRLGHDEAGTWRFLSQQPAFLADDERRIAGWLRLLLSRPKLVLLAGRALPQGAPGRQVLALLEEELTDCALVVVHDAAPAGFSPLSFHAVEANSP